MADTQTALQLRDLIQGNRTRQIERFLQDRNNAADIINLHLGNIRYTALHEAACRKNADILRILLSYGGQVDILAAMGYTPLHVASSIGSINCIKVLLEFSADVMKTDELQNTPHQTAWRSKRKDTAKFLKTEELKRLVLSDDATLETALEKLRAGSDFDENFFEEALQIALEKNCLIALECIMVRLPNNNNVQNCLESALISVRIKEVTVFLLLCNAIREYDVEMVQLIYSKSTMENSGSSKEVEQLKRKFLPKEWNRVLGGQKLIEIRHTASSLHWKFKKFQIRLAMHAGAVKIAKIILVESFCVKDKKTAEWAKLSLRHLYPAFFADITNFEVVKLTGNKLSLLPRDLFKMQSLTNLELVKNKICNVPKDIFEMKCLTTLNLSFNEIRTMPKVESWSKAMKYLHLNGNKLTSVDESIAESTLVTLDLRGNRLTYVQECLLKIGTLESLDLSGNRGIKVLPAGLAKLTKLTYLGIGDLDQLTDPPASERGPTTRIIRYLMAKLRNSKPFYVMKLMIVGLANCGKTTLMHRISKDFSFQGNQSTQGVDIREIAIQNATFKCWDFAGQKEYYATHQCFLSQRSLYLLVWNVMDGDQGIAAMKPWLDNIQCRAPYSSVIIVGTHLDRRNADMQPKVFEDRINSKVFAFVSKYKELNIDRSRVLMVTCNVEQKYLKDCKQGIEKLRSLIYEVACKTTVDGKLSSANVIGEMIPESYLSLAKLLSQKQVELEEDGKLPILRKSEFENLVTENAKAFPQDFFDPDDVALVTKFLNDTGLILHYEDPNQDLRDLYFIRPSWLCGLMAEIVAVNEVHSFTHNGILYEKDMQFIIQNKTKTPHTDLHLKLLRLLARFQVAYRIDQQRILIPSMLPVSNPVGISSMQETCYPLIIRRLSFSCIPFGFMSRLISRILVHFNEMLNAPIFNENDRDVDDSQMQFRTQPDGSECENALDNDIGKGVQEFESTQAEQSCLPTNTAAQERLHDTNIIEHANNKDRNKDLSYVEESADTCSLDIVDGEPDDEGIAPFVPFVVNGIYPDEATIEGDSAIGEGIVAFVDRNLPVCDEPSVESRTILTDVTVPPHFSNRSPTWTDSDIKESIGTFDQVVSIASFLDERKLICWRQGILFNHEKLFLLVSILPKVNERELIEIKVSKSQLGYRVFAFIIDHIRTIINEWFRHLQATDGLLPRVQPLAPCPICLDFGINPPYYFQITECVKESNHAICPNYHIPQGVNLSEICPELLLRDLDPSMHIVASNLKYEESSEHLLGRGNFPVYKGTYNGKHAAIKVYTGHSGMGNRDTMDLLYEMRKEAVLLSRAGRHPSILTFYGGLAQPKSILVVEVATTGSLRNVLKDPKEDIQRIVKYRMAQQTASAVSYLHSLGIIHRDLKSDNLLVFSLKEDSEINIKLADFGTANFISPVGLKQFTGTDGFIAPEICAFSKTDEYNAKVDVYSYSMVLYELICQRRPFHFLCTDKRNSAAQEGRRPPFHDVDLSRYSLLTLTELMISSWNQEPDKRPSSRQIKVQLKSPAFCLLYGKVPLKAIKNAYYLCFVRSTCEIWMAYNDEEGSAVLIVDPITSEVKRTLFPGKELLSTTNDYLCTVVLSIHEIDHDYVSILLNSKFQYMVTYCLRKNKVIAAYPIIDKWVSAIAVGSTNLIIGFKDGDFMKLSKTNFVEGNLEYKYLVGVNKERSISAVSVFEATSSRNNREMKLLIGCDKYIYRYPLMFDDSAAVEFEEIKAGNEREFVSQIELSDCGNNVFVSYTRSPTIKVFAIQTMDSLGDIDSSKEIERLMPGSNMYDQRVTCFCINGDTLWAGTGSGHILIYRINSSGEHSFITHLRPYQLEVRAIISFPNPKGNLHRLIATIGKKVNLAAFCCDKEGLCLLTGAFPVDPSLEEAAEDKRGPEKGRKSVGKRNSDRKANEKEAAVGKSRGQVESKDVKIRNPIWKRRTPEGRNKTPEGRHRSPDARAYSPDARRCGPDGGSGRKSTSGRRSTDGRKSENRKNADEFEGKILLIWDGAQAPVLKRLVEYN